MRRSRVRPFVVVVLLLAAARAPAVAGGPAPTAESAPLVYVGLNEQGAEEWVRPKDGALVVRVPGGDYLRRPYEGWVAVEEAKPFPVRSFFVDKHEVTNARFARFLNAHEDVPRLVRPDVPGLLRGAGGTWSAGPGLEQHPVTAATGFGALAYSAWVGARLPTQPEWEKAAGGTQGRLYPWGEAPPDASRANFADPDARGLEPVGSHPAGASPYGVLDMAGNAYDRVVPDRPGRADAGTLPVMLPVMLKGGSWLSPHPLNLRVLDLCMQAMEVADRSVGFRCAMEDPEPDRPVRGAQAPPGLRLAKDFPAAVAQARERRVPIFLSLLYDTCGQCDRIRAQAYRDPRFVAYANERLVVVMGHQPGDAMDEPHPAREDGTCPLYAGLTCDEHEILFARGLKVVGGFTVSPGNFLLHPDRVLEGAGKEAILVGEEAFPKWGGDVDAYLAAFERARTEVR